MTTQYNNLLWTVCKQNHDNPLRSFSISILGFIKWFEVTQMPTTYIVASYKITEMETNTIGSQPTFGSNPSKSHAFWANKIQRFINIGYLMKSKFPPLWSLRKLFPRNNFEKQHKFEPIAKVNIYLFDLNIYFSEMRIAPSSKRLKTEVKAYENRVKMVRYYANCLEPLSISRPLAVQKWNNRSRVGWGGVIGLRMEAITVQMKPKLLLSNRLFS